MEAVGYMLIYLFKGELPWQGISAESVREKAKLTLNLKRQTKIEDLCSDMPNEFTKYMKSVRSLEFEEDPKYKNYINMFHSLCSRSGFDPYEGFYDWDRKHRARPPNQRT